MIRIESCILLKIVLDGDGGFRYAHLQKHRKLRILMYEFSVDSDYETIHDAFCKCVALSMKVPSFQPLGQRSRRA